MRPIARETIVERRQPALRWTIGGLRRTRLRGLARTQFGTYLIGAAYNLLRITNLRRQLA